MLLVSLLFKSVILNYLITYTLWVAASSLFLNEPPIVRAQIGRPPEDTAHKDLKERALFINVDRKFAQITADVDDMFLDDETSPTDSLVSSIDSDEIISKRNKKKINDAIKEKDDVITPLMLDLSSPLMSPGTPTHASRSLSLSDEGGRDFLIDDEIADQPALCFSKNHGENAFVKVK